MPNQSSKFAEQAEAEKKRESERHRDARIICPLPPPRYKTESMEWHSGRCTVFSSNKPLGHARKTPGSQNLIGVMDGAS